MEKISINFDEKSNKFLIKCDPEYNNLIMGLPDRRFRKGSRVWAAPALKRNVQYMERHLNNCSMYSKEALAKYNTCLKKLTKSPRGSNKFPEYFDFKTTPMNHQMEGLKKFYPLDEAGIFFEQGLGKTYTSINLAVAWKMTNQIDAVVVICPSSIKSVWQEELDTHCPILTQQHVLTSGKHKKAEEFINSRTDFQWLIVGIEGISQGKAHSLLKEFLIYRNCVIIVDESSRIKTPNTTRTSRCISFSKHAKKRIIMSGTSVTQGVEDLYTQLKFLNPEIIGFNSFFSFRSHFCVTMPIQVSKDRFIQKIVGYKNEDELLKLISPYVMRVEKSDVLDLPPKTFSNRCLDMNPTQKKIYDEMRLEFATTIDNKDYEVTSVLEQMLRLQQITGGHYPFDDGKRIVMKPIPGKNPKIVELENLIAEISGKVIIWCQFRPEIELVLELLTRIGVGVTVFHGGCTDAQKLESIEKLKNDPETKIFLATRAAAFGLTLVEASTAIYFSQGYSLEEYSQSQDRIHRIGQNAKCTYIHLVCKKTIDIQIIKAVKDKESIATLIYSMIKDN